MHERNLIGSNESPAAMLVRAHMLWQGRFKSWADMNVAALGRIEGLMTDENKKIFDLFRQSRKKSFFPAWRGCCARASIGNHCSATSAWRRRQWLERSDTAARERTTALWHGYTLRQSEQTMKYDFVPQTNSRAELEKVTALWRRVWPKNRRFRGTSGTSPRCPLRVKSPPSSPRRSSGRNPSVFAGCRRAWLDRMLSGRGSQRHARSSRQAARSKDRCPRRN